MKQLTIEEFIKKATSLHSGKYSYHLVNYKSTSNKVTVVCPIHGNFDVSANNHLYNKTGCKQCGIISRSNKKRNDFEKRAKKTHGDYYDYSKVKYKRLDERVTIICPEHGEFTQIPSSHFRGNGCKLCSGKSWNTEIFIKKSKEKWGEKYGYLKTNYLGYDKKITLTCPEHGDFITYASSHLTSVHAGCKNCYIQSMRLTTEEFIDRATSKHGNLYDYSKVNYVTAKQKVTIICKKHGPFNQEPFNHIDLGQGCPSCPILVSKSHQEIIDTLTSMGVNNIKINDRSVLESKELDIFLPDFSLAIEIDGVWFHSSKFKDDRNYHQKKQDECQSLGIKLLQFWDFDIRDRLPVVQSMLRKHLNKNLEKIHARKCMIKKLSSIEFRNFLEDTHLQGGFFSAQRHGLYYKNELVAVMGITKKRGENILDRFSSKRNTIIVGGFSKLLKSFDIKGEIVTHSANRYSQGNVYKKMGFSLVHEHPFTLYYTDGKNLFSRNKYQKHKLVNLPNYDKSLTADEILRDNDIYSVYGSGTKTWLLKN